MDDLDFPLDISDDEAKELGNPRSMHPGGSTILKVNIAIASTFTAILGVSAIGLLIAHFGSPGKSHYIGAAIFGGLAILTAIGVWSLARKLRWSLYLFDNGFVFAHGDFDLILWSSVREFYGRQDVVAGIAADRRLRFVLDDGEVKIDSSYRDFAEFQEFAENGVTRAILKTVSAALGRRESVEFGELTLSRAGLEKDVAKFVGRSREKLTFAELHSVVVETRHIGNGTASAVVVFRKDPKNKTGKKDWYAHPAFSFPNVAVFLTLAEKATSAK